ncbi:MAG: 30S ribosomal protein S6 [Geobacteraceae bacterium]|nr:30S ribosomal protein S6 [Geobacteraceae bacterium]
MRKYETIYIVHPDLGDEDIKALSEKVQDVIAGFKGECYRLEDWGMRKLAYPLKKQARGRYFYLNFEGNPALIAELERRLRLDDKVLRYQSVKLEKDVVMPAAAVEKPAADVSAEPIVSEAAESETTAPAE